ncbi:MAG: response regulator [Fibrobacteres bacterium]|nr:response regulator [Fibrobacterota bacterium]
MPNYLQSLPPILVVDDEKVVRTLIRLQLEEAGYPVLEAPGGREAIQLILDRNTPIELLVTDVLMPFMNGRELATRASIIRPDIRVLFISAYSANLLIDLGVAPTGADFLRKPFKTGELTDRVKKLLAVGRTWRQVTAKTV